MKTQYHLTDVDIRAAIKMYVQEMAGIDDGAQLDVHLLLTRGDRPGESDSWTASVWQADPAKVAT